MTQISIDKNLEGVSVANKKRRLIKYAQFTVNKFVAKKTVYNLNLLSLHRSLVHMEMSNCD